MAKEAAILIVEDSDEDFYATNRALTTSGVANSIHRCIDGEQALDYLFQRGAYNSFNAPRPNIILLDLNMPRINGKAVLHEIKASSNVCNIPVVIFTTSTDDMDIDQCYKLGANSYIQKPISLEKFVESIRMLKEYWFEIVILPKKDDNAK